MRLNIECLGKCRRKYLLSSQRNQLPMPRLWNVGSDNLPTECRECGGCINIVDTEKCLRVHDEVELGNGVMAAYESLKL